MINLQKLRVRSLKRKTLRIMPDDLKLSATSDWVVVKQNRPVVVVSSFPKSIKLGGEPKLDLREVNEVLRSGRAPVAPATIPAQVEKTG